MASALSLNGCLLLPSQTKKFQGSKEGGANGKARSLFLGKVIRTQFLGRERYGMTRKALFPVASVFGGRTKVQKKETVIPTPDYRIPVVLLGISGGLIYSNNLLPAAPAGLLGLLLLFQTTRVRFVFDDEALEVKVGDQLQESGENVFVGGKNRWRYSTFVNWELWWPNFPILVYFKEKQTKPEGQVHFFPVIFDGKQLYDVMVERCGPTKTSSPK